MTTDIGKWIARATSSLISTGIKSARLDAELLLCHTENITREFIASHPEHVFDSAKADRLIQQRVDGEPLAYIIGYRDFYGRQFVVTPNVLIPRPETEVLVSTTLELIKWPRTRLLDMGCGSGCIGITLKLERPDLDITLVDISPSALDVTRKNLVKFGIVESTVNLVQSNLFESITGQYDIIVANLPYISRQWQTSTETKFEPELALYADGQGLGLIKQLIDCAPNYLISDGHLVIELDTRQINDVKKYATSSGFEIVSEQPFTLVLKLA